MGRQNWLFLDMNSFFASCEQQAEPDLRGRPVAVVPTLVNTSCVIAASYEAKVFGVKTGTGVAQARQLCPNIRFIEANPERYRDFHWQITEAVEQCIPVSNVLSVDEMVCQLWVNEAKLWQSLRLGQDIQRVISDRVGDWLTCSVGIAPNGFLAKVASDFQKPRGLSVVMMDDLPNKMFGLSLTDWPGISTRMEKRFRAAGVHTTEQMYRLSYSDMRRIWGGVVGERWWRMLRGENVPLPATKRGQFGHSSVLHPDLRTRAGARAAGARLLERAAERMRFHRYHTRRLVISVCSFDNQAWTKQIRMSTTNDTWHLLGALNMIWVDDIKIPYQVSVSLSDVLPDRNVTGNLFAEQQRIAWEQVDALNARYGRTTIVTASGLPAKSHSPERIPFGNIDTIYRSSALG